MATQPPAASPKEPSPAIDQPLEHEQEEPHLSLTPPQQTSTRFRRFIIIALVALLLFLTAFLRLLSYSMTRRMQDVITLPPPDEYIVLPSFEATSSWKSFTASAVNLEFRLPAALSRFGDVEERAWSVEPFSGSELCISLDQLLTYAKRQCDFDTFGIFAISSDYSVGRGAGFGDFQGFRRYKGKFLGKITTKEFEIPPEVAQEMLNSHGVRMLKVIGRTDPNGDDFPTPGEGWIGAIVATPDATFPALNVQLKLGNDLTEETFDQILSTLRFTEPTNGGTTEEIPVGWKRIDANGKFSFSIPPSLIKDDTSSADSFAEGYSNENFKLSFDYGPFSDPLEEYAQAEGYKEQTITISGKPANIIAFRNTDKRRYYGFAYFTAVHFDSLEIVAGDPWHLTLQALTQTESDLETAQKIFRSLTFPK